MIRDVSSYEAYLNAIGCFGRRKGTTVLRSVPGGIPGEVMNCFANVIEPIGI